MSQGVGAFLRRGGPYDPAGGEVIVHFGESQEAFLLFIFVPAFLTSFTGHRPCSTRHTLVR